jgi:hypothetical protein
MLTPTRQRMNDVELFEELARTRKRLLEQIGRVIVGQEPVVELMLTALFAQGHCLFIGVPRQTQWRGSPLWTIKAPSFWSTFVPPTRICA